MIPRDVTIVVLDGKQLELGCSVRERASFCLETAADLAKLLRPGCMIGIIDDGGEVMWQHKVTEGESK